MGDLSIEQIKNKANQARDLFKDYIESLVTAGRTRKANDAEIYLFNLESFYSDNELTASEANSLKTKVNNLDLNNLINSGVITYSNREEKIKSQNGVFDFNRDGAINQRDQSALEYILNYKGNPVNSVFEILEIAGDPDRIADYQITRWATERGLEEGSSEFTSFYNKFYRDLYKNLRPSMETEELQRLLVLYDLGTGKDNLNELDPYIPLVRSDLSVKNIKLFYSFLNSEVFDVRDEQFSTKRDQYINILTGNDATKKQFLLEALVRKQVPISNEKLKVSTLDPMLEIAGNQPEISRFTINKWADQRNLRGEERELFFNKFYKEFHKEATESGLRFGLLKPLLDIYDNYRRDSSVPLDINKLDTYADGIKKSVQGETLIQLNKFERSGNFNLTGQEREEAFQKYFRILTGSSNNAKSYFLQALANKEIPFSKEPLNAENLNVFIEQISTEGGLIDLTIDSWAKSRGYINLSSSQTDDYDTFINKFKEYSNRGLTLGQLQTLYGFLIKGNISPQEINKLDIYASSLRQRVDTKFLTMLNRFENSENFQIESSQRDDLIESYIDIFKDGTKEEKEVLQRTLLNGKKVFLTESNLTVENLNFALEEVRKNNGYNLLIINNIVNKQNLDSSQKAIFSTKLQDWILPQNPPKRNYQLTIEQARNLLGFYKEGEISLDDLDVYAKALKERVPFNALREIYKFENEGVFKSQVTNREIQLEAYIEVVKSGKKQKTSEMIKAMKTNKIPITGEDLSLTKLDEALAKFDDPKVLSEAYIQEWFKGQRNSEIYISEFLEYLNNSSFQLELGELSSLKSLIKENENLDINSLDIYARAVKEKVNYKSLKSLAKLHSNPNYNGTKEKIIQYIDIIKNGNKNEKYVLLEALTKNRIPYASKTLIEANKINLDELDNVLELVQDGDKLNKYIIENWARQNNLNENTQEFSDYVFKFFDDYLIDKKLSMNTLRQINEIYKTREYTYEYLDVMVHSLKQGLDGDKLIKLEKIARRNNLTQEVFQRYINILLGREGDAKKKILDGMLRNGQIPVSGLSI